MDPFQIIKPFLKIFWWFLPIIIIGILKTSRAKGYFGELLVRLLAGFMLDKNIYHRVNNVTLPTPDGTTQIDHIFISRFGIFVIETKNMRGWIFGGEDQAQWTQKIYKQTFKFQNPLRQNFKHTKTLETALQIPLDTIHSVVTFIGDSSFKTYMPRNVTHGIHFISYIKSFKERVFTESQVKDLLLKIESVRFAPTLAVHMDHVQNLKTRSNPNAERRCPKCGSILVLRTIKSGEKVGQQFWGCSAFPKCRLTQNLISRGKTPGRP
jgi:restriction system protein